MFRQESSFYYYTGLKEPALCMTIDIATGYTVLFIPAYATDRTQWMVSEIDQITKNPAEYMIDEVRFLGKSIKGFQAHQFDDIEMYGNLIEYFSHVLQKNKIFTLLPKHYNGLIDQQILLMRLMNKLPLADSIQDISSLVGMMRRKKDMYEVECVFSAVEITILAQEAAAQAIKEGICESEVQANLEYIMIGLGAQTAFPSIVASGKCGTMLHYHQNDSYLGKDDLVVVDIGAQYLGYCADLTRTYPVGRKYSDRQKELYSIVYDTQEYIADIAQAGYWINNKENPEKSLHHRAKFLENSLSSIQTPGVDIDVIADSILYLSISFFEESMDHIILQKHI